MMKTFYTNTKKVLYGLLVSVLGLTTQAHAQGYETSILPLNATWKYSDLGVFPGANWTQLSFNDSTWQSGQGILGYGEGDETTVLSFGPSSSNKYIAYYFRTTFNITNPNDFKSYLVRLIRDDGAVVYINGVEAFRNKMPSGTITNTTLASGGAVGGHQERLFYEFDVDPNLFVQGTNIIAVQVHQDAVTSSDLSFHLEIRASEYQKLVAPGAEWKYLDNGSDQGTAWIDTNFNDAAWASGKSILFVLSLLTLNTSLFSQSIKEAEYRKKKVFYSVGSAIQSGEKVEHLNLRQTGLTSVSPEIGQLKDVQYINLMKNKITAFPDELGELKKLIELNARQNAIDVLTPRMAELKSLEILELSRNKLTAFDKPLTQIKSLKVLDLGSNQIHFINPEVKRLKALNTLEIANNKINNLPNEIGKLKSLVTLNLGFNQITTLPSQIVKLKKLESLNIEKNQLTEIPNHIGQLKSIKILILSHNQLQSLPESIGQCSQLEGLILGYNQLSSLPESIKNLNKLNLLILSGNPISESEQEKIKTWLPNVDIRF